MKIERSRKQRAQSLLKRIKKVVPDAKMLLKYSNPWECLVAVMLSAQCTDVQVNKVTERLFRKYRSIDEYASARPREFEKDIYSTGFYRNKTKHILAAANMILDAYGGVVPKTMKELLVLPGLGRKTANVVLGNCYGVVEGIAVDTHVKRLSRVFGLTKHADPNKIEQDLMRLFPKSEWFALTYYLIEYGRRYCTAKPHNHANCPLANFYC